MSMVFEETIFLSAYTTFRIGGPARFFVEVLTIEEMQEAIGWAKEKRLRYFVLGKGSNILFDERGFNGLVILNKINFLNDMGDGHIHVGAGYSFSHLGVLTARRGWEGLEFASGIPGTVGGAVFMNAGANGQETCQCLQGVDFMGNDGVRTTLKKDDLSFSYRSSCFQKMRGAIVGARFQLKPSCKARQRQIDFINYRTNTQPYGKASAGCSFRNPPGTAAGKLIEECGMKGAHVGDAKVSLKHGNFIVNDGSASSKDILTLIEKVKNRVREKTGVYLKEELLYIPFTLEKKENE